MTRATKTILSEPYVANGMKRFACTLVAVSILGLSPSMAGENPDSKAEAAAPSPSDAPKIDAGNPSAGKADASKSDASKSDASKADASKSDTPKSDTAKTDTVSVSALPEEAEAGVRKYCVNIAAAATDARFTWQSKKLTELEAKIKSRIAELDAKQAELKGWYDRREAINKEARENIVGIYAKMKPENAAAQISALDDDMATAVLAALPANKASAIFNEMTSADRAAKLAGLLANPSAQPSDKKL